MIVHMSFHLDVIFGHPESRRGGDPGLIIVFSHNLLLDSEFC
jgi:hypothetical protein